MDSGSLLWDYEAKLNRMDQREVNLLVHNDIFTGLKEWIMLEMKHITELPIVIMRRFIKKGLYDFFLSEIPLN